MKKDPRFQLFISMLAAFLLWLVAIMVIFFQALKPEDLNPVIALVAGLGIGGVTQAFILMLKDAWQFFFRKAGPLAKE